MLYYLNWMAKSIFSKATAIGRMRAPRMYWLKVARAWHFSPDYSQVWITSMLHLRTRWGMPGLFPVYAILFVPGCLLRGCPLREDGASLITISIKRGQSTLPLPIRMGFPIYSR